MRRSLTKIRAVGHAAWRDVRRGVHRLDVRRPAHALLIGAVIGGVAAPALGYLANEARYGLASDATRVVAHANPNLVPKLTYDSATNTSYFNRGGTSNNQNELILQTGGGGKKSNQLYTATLPDQATSGITVSDNANSMSVTMRPQFGLLGGRIKSGHVVYPLDGRAGQLVFTPKANGLKEDILLDHSVGDQVAFTYELDLPDSLQARLLPSGAVGIFSGDPTLFGNITYGSDADRQKVELARKNATKTYLMFEIPAPVVNQADGLSHGVQAHFTLDGTRLTVSATNLARASYPLSIDPTFVISSLSDFNLGRAEDNISFTNNGDGEIARATITGGLASSSGWQATSGGSTLPTGCSESGDDYNFGMTAYNGYLYLVGGGAGSTTYNCDVPINSDGTLGTWVVNTTTGAGASTFSVGRTGGCMVGWNGFVYMMGGETANGGTQFTTVEYAAVNSDGSLDWRGTVSAMNVGRVYFGCTVYAGVIYAYGGATRKNNGTLVASAEYAKINADGSLGTWSTTTSFTTARDRFGAAAYNGYVYLVGGFTGTAALNNVQYAPIKSDGSLGTWVTAATTLPGNQRSQGLAVERGYLYSFGGCSTTTACSGPLSTTYYAPVHADGSVGKWDTSAALTSTRFYNGGASYNGVLYSVGGCTAEPTNNNNCSGGAALGDSQYATISSTPGDVIAPTATASSLSVARAGVATVAYNGYLYAAGGCNGTNCATMSATVNYALVNDDGSVGTWAATTAGLPVGRYGGSMVGYGGKVYYLGGDTGSGAGSTVVYSATPSSGNISAWTTETNTFSSPRFWASATVNANYLYITGGTGTGGPFNTVEYTQLVNGAWSSPANCASNGGSLTNNWCKASNTISTPRYGHAAVAYDGNLYVVAGQDGSNTLLSDTQKSVLGGVDGYPGAFSTTGQAALPSPGTDTAIGHRFISVGVSGSVLYVYGGLNNGASAASTIEFAPIDASGNVTAWTKSSRTLATARWGAGGTLYDGNIYVTGGCSSNTAPPCSAYLASAEAGKTINGGAGTLGLTSVNTNPWATSANTFTARADQQIVAYNSKIYVIGGCTAYTSGTCSAWSTVVQHALITETGNVGAWTATSGADVQLGVGRSYGAAVAYNGKIYVLGGWANSTTDTADVLMGTLDVNGNITGWTALGSSPMPSTRHGFGATVSGQYLYVAGGSHSGTLQNDVMYSQIASDGTLTAPANCTVTSNWCSQSSAFTTPRVDLSVVSYNAVVYVIGGYDGSNNLGDVQYAALSSSDGSIGTFKPTTSLDLKARARGAMAANGYMYFFGTENSGSDVFYAAINANGTLGPLNIASASGMVSANHAHGGAVYSDGYFYVIGGCTLSAGSCTSTIGNSLEYAGQKASARLAHYSKLFNTQVDTAPAQLVVNGSLGSGDSIFTASLQTSTVAVPTLGVAQLINPALPGQYNGIQALDSSGTNVGIAYNYFIVLTLDDSGSGTFPDSASQITDFSIYYHANPGRRLRHGASFTNTGCNTVATEGCLLDTAP